MKLKLKASFFFNNNQKPLQSFAKILSIIFVCISICQTFFFFCFLVPHKSHLSVTSNPDGFKLCTKDLGVRRTKASEACIILQPCLTLVVWHLAQIYILTSALTGSVNHDMILFYIRMATCNQILDPWIYITFQLSRLRRIKSKINVKMFFVFFVFFWHSSLRHCSPTSYVNFGLQITDNMSDPTCYWNPWVHSFALYSATDAKALSMSLPRDWNHAW